MIDLFIKVYKNVQNKKEYSINLIRTDHGGKFDCKLFEIFCDENGLNHNFSALKIPQ